jgi:hypothetical protein
MSRKNVRSIATARSLKSFTLGVLMITTSTVFLMVALPIVDKSVYAQGNNNNWYVGKGVLENTY